MAAVNRQGKRSLRRVLLGITLTIVTVIVIWVVWVSIVIVHPHLDSPGPADAIVVLGPSLDPRVAQARELASSYHIPEIVFSVGDTQGQVDGLCGTEPNSGNNAYAAGKDTTTSGDVQVSCFTPDPYTTGGEAHAIEILGQQRGWHHILVIAARPQVSRARLLIHRCFPGTFATVAAVDYPDIDLDDLIHQTGGFVKAVFDSPC